MAKTSQNFQTGANENWVTLIIVVSERPQ